MTDEQLKILMLTIRVNLLEQVALKSEIFLRALLQREPLDELPVDQVSVAIEAFRAALEESQRGVLAGRVGPPVSEYERAMLADELNEIFERLRRVMERLFSY